MKLPLTLILYQGIEALEGYLDPAPKEPEKEPDQTDPAAADPAAAAASAAAPAAAPAEPAPGGGAAEPTPMICKKGKCRPYDPTKDKVGRSLGYFFEILRHITYGT